MNIPSRNVFVRPSTFLYDESVSKSTSKLQFRPPTSTQSTSHPRHSVQLESPVAYTQFREPAWKLFPPNFEHILALSKKDAKYKPVPRDVAETHMAMFHDFDEKMSDEGRNPLYHLPHGCANKNRYTDVLPNTHNRVKIVCPPATTIVDPSADYINASAIVPPADVPGLAHTYIACQAPPARAFSAMWQMVWEQHTELIVMLTRFQESGRCKAQCYWPTQTSTPSVEPLYRTPPISSLARQRSQVGSSALEAESLDTEVGAVRIYGNIQVRVLSVSLPHPEVAIREFELVNLREGEEQTELAQRLRGEELEYWQDQQFRNPRRVSMVQFTGWPDHGVPSDMDAPCHLLKYYREKRALMSDPTSPIVVHCSAGLGRTGTFIAVDEGLDYIAHIQQQNSERITQDLRTLAPLLQNESLQPHEVDRSKFFVGVNAVVNQKLTPPKRHVDENGFPLLLRGVDLRIIADLVFAMRTCRPGMVQRKEQYALIFLLLQHCTSHPQRRGYFGLL